MSRKHFTATVAAFFSLVLKQTKPIQLMKCLHLLQPKSMHAKSFATQRLQLLHTRCPAITTAGIVHMSAKVLLKVVVQRTGDGHSCLKLINNHCQTSPDNKPTLAGGL